MPLLSVTSRVMSQEKLCAHSLLPALSILSSGLQLIRCLYWYMTDCEVLQGTFVTAQLISQPYILISICAVIYF